ncbi:hypothetical protein BH11MYX4_BH11MYX4_02550 [soil metagenome]
MRNVSAKRFILPSVANVLRAFAFAVSTTSSASATLTVGSPEPFLWIFTQISVSRAWWARIHASNARWVRKARIFV